MTPHVPSRGRRFHAWRIPFLALAIGALITGMWGGLLRLGWGIPLPHANWISYHGAIMVSGFLGTLIALERAVGTGLRWAYVAPIFSGLATVSLLLGMPLQDGGPGILVASGLLLILQTWMTLRYRQFFQAVLAVAVACWFVGNILWMNRAPVHEMVLWWMAFLVLTIAGERLELNRFLPRTPLVIASFVVATSVFLSGVIATLKFPEAGSYLAGAGMLLTSAWLVRNDIARRTIRATGLTRYIAVCLLSGYAWLAGAGVMLVLVGPQDYGLLYDAFLHSVFLGFVFMMIFGHAPVIFPSVVGLDYRWSARMYVHVVLLHATLALRVLGDLFVWPEVRSLAGLLNAIAILVFLANTVTSLKWPRPRKDDPTPLPATTRMESSAPGG